MAKYTIDSKQIIEKEIAHLKNAMLFTTSKPEYEKLIKNKEDELKECEEWLNSKEGVTLKIKDIENTIKYRKLALDQKHPMTTSEDIKEMVYLLHKYEEELKLYTNKLKEFDTKNVKESKQVKKQSNSQILLSCHIHPLDTKVRAPTCYCTCDICSNQIIIGPYYNCKKCEYDVCHTCFNTQQLSKCLEPKESKPKKKTISSTMKKLVWNTNIGEDIGKTKCLCCKSTDITQMSFNCGHVISEHNGGETIVSNLKPICQNCNSSMGTKNMNEFMLSLM